jgi:hypothetical protein
MTLEEITQELKAIAQADTLYLLEEEHTAEGTAGFRSRQERKRELLELAQSQKAKAAQP